MQSSSLPLRALWSALGVAAYIAALATVVINGERIFGHVDNSVFAPIAFLLLFVFSALLTGSLVLLAPIRLYLDGQKKEGVQLLIYTGVWLGILMLMAAAMLFIA